MIGRKMGAGQDEDDFTSQPGNSEARVAYGKIVALDN